MKRRFEVTLLAVAIASLSASAFALAPTINDFRSPIIADDTPATGSNDFVFPDALDLTNQGQDPDSTVQPSGIIWSFTSLTGPTTVDSTYRLNNVAAMDIGGGDNPNAPGAKQVNGTHDDPDHVDGSTQTVTFRNFALSPTLSDTQLGTMSTALDGQPGIHPEYTRVITMFASDGTSYTMGTAGHGTFLIYTDKNGGDRFSGAATMQSILPPATPLTTGGSPWTSFNQFTGIGGFTDPTFSSATSGASTGLCIATPLTPSSIGSWYSPFGILPLVANQVYRIRIHVSAPTAIAVGQSPLWDFVIDNVDAGQGITPTHLDGKYGDDFLFWDNSGGANSAGADPNSLTQPGRHTFDLWFCPLAVNSAGWNDSSTGEFAPGKSATNGGRLQFRVLDATQSAVDGENDAGTLCMSSFQIDRIAYSDLTVLSTPFNVSSSGMTLSAFNVNNLFGAKTSGSAGTFGDMTVSVSGGISVVPNTTGAWDAVEIVTLDPGDGVFNPVADTGIPDDYPFTYQSNQLLRFTAGVQAPDAASETSPPDAFRMDFGSPSNEVLETNILGLYVNQIGKPVQASVTDFASFMFTHNITSSSNPADWARIRPRIGVITRADLHGTTHPGGFKVTYEKVDVIDTTGF